MRRLFGRKPVERLCEQRMRRSSKRHASSAQLDEKEQHPVSILAGAAASVGTDSDTASSLTDIANDAAIAAAANELDFGYEFGAADPSNDSHDSDSDWDPASSSKCSASDTKHSAAATVATGAAATDVSAKTKEKPCSGM